VRVTRDHLAAVIVAAGFAGHILSGETWHTALDARVTGLSLVEGMIYRAAAYAAAITAGYRLVTRADPDPRLLVLASGVAVAAVLRYLLRMREAVTVIDETLRAAFPERGLPEGADYGGIQGAAWAALGVALVALAASIGTLLSLRAEDSRNARFDAARRKG